MNEDAKKELFALLDHTGPAGRNALVAAIEHQNDPEGIFDTSSSPYCIYGVLANPDDGSFSERLDRAYALRTLITGRESPSTPLERWAADNNIPGRRQTLNPDAQTEILALIAEWTEGVLVHG